MPDCLHEFNEVHIGEDLRTLSGIHDNGLFFDCTFCNLNGLTLKDCDLNRSKFVTEKVRDALGFALTLDCKSFRNVEYSELLFDLMLVLLSQTRGNDLKRKQLEQVVGAERMWALLRVLKRTE